MFARLIVCEVSPVVLSCSVLVYGTAVQSVTAACCLVSLQMTDIGMDTLDVWVDKLMGCNPLSENEVKQLCDKARIMPFVVVSQR